MELYEMELKNGDFYCFSNMFPMTDGRGCCALIYKLPDEKVTLKRFYAEEKAARFAENVAKEQGVTAGEFFFKPMLEFDRIYRLYNEETDEYVDISVEKEPDKLSTKFNTSLHQHYLSTKIHILDTSELEKN